MDKGVLSFGIIIGFVIGIAFASIPIVESAIPPTRAFQAINVSLPWFTGDDHLVESETSTDTVFFVSDGSITFNVTTTAP